MAVVADGHSALADLLNARSPDEIKFGPNMTSLTLHVSRSIGASLAPDAEIVVTTLDHEANVGPWRSMAADRGLAVQTVDIVADDGTLDLEDLGAKLSRGPGSSRSATRPTQSARSTRSPTSSRWPTRPAR